MSATSSSLGLADIALVLASDGGSADIAMIDSDIASDAGLETAAILSLMLDRRAEVDNIPPSGDITDLRGWWADEFLEPEGDHIGSRLWLLDRAKRTGETAKRAEEYVREALQWLLDDRVVASIDVTIELVDEDLRVAISLNRAGKSPIQLRFAHVWEAQAAA